MPNWVMNKIKVGNIKAIKECVTKNESGVEEYDFNKIIPMPDNIYRGNLGMKEREKYGENNWYDWSIKNWGTKWNADNYCRTDKLEFTFQTAWATPEPVIKEMSKKYNCAVEVTYADEDCGYNCGEYTYRKGELIHEWHPEFGTDEARKFADETWEYEGDE